ncbi:MAG: MBG domain-containing protein [Bacteroidota bacterium]
MTPRLSPTLFIFLLFILPSSIIAQTDYYWVGDGGTWDDLNHWATNSGGTVLHTELPNENDNVIFDENSFTQESQTVSLSSNAVCNNIDWSMASFRPRFSSSSSYELDIHGQLTLTDSVIMSGYLGDLVFLSDDPVDVDFGKNRTFNQATSSWARMHFEGNGPFVIQDSVLSGQFYLRNAAQLDFNQQFVDFRELEIISNFTGSIDVTGAEIHTEVLDFQQMDSDLYTYLDDSETEIFVSSRLNIRDANRNFGHVSIARELSDNSLNPVSVFVSGQTNDSIRFRSFTVEPFMIVTIQSGLVLETELVELTGTRTMPITLNAQTTGERASISVENGIIEANYLDIKDIHAVGGATFNALNSLDGGGNIGWNFSAPQAIDFYWVGNTGNWNDPTHWATTSGGTTLHQTPPTRFDNVIFDANSFSSNSSVTINNSILNECKDIDFSDIDVDMTFRAVNFLARFNVYGSFTASRSVSFDNFRTDINFMSSSAADITMNGNATVGEDDEIKFFGDGPFTFQDSVREGRFEINNNAVIDFNERYVDAQYLRVNSNFTGTLDISNCQIHLGQLTISSNNDYSFLKEGSDILINRSLANTGRTINLGNVTFQKGTSDFLLTSNRSDGTVEFDTLTIDPGNTLVLEANYNLAFDHLIAVGERAAPITIRSNEPGVETTFISDAASIEGTYLDLKDIHGSGGATYLANFSVDNGNNTGWSFTVPPSFDYYWVGGAGSWSEASLHWATSSGGTSFHDAPPSRLDNVFFDENSFAQDNETVLIDLDAAMGTLHIEDIQTGAGFSNGQDDFGLEVFGDFTIDKNFDLSLFDTYIQINSENDVDITTNANRSFNSDLQFDFFGSGTFNFMDSVFMPQITINDRGSYQLNGNYFDIDRLTFNSQFQGVWDMSDVTMRVSQLTNSRRNSPEFDLIKDRSLLYIDNRFSNADRDYNYGNVVLENTNASVRLNSSGLNGATFDTLTIEPGATVFFEFIARFRMSEFIAQGTPNQPIFLRNTNPGGNRTSIIEVTEGTINGTYLDMNLIEGRGGAVFNAYNSVDSEGNVGWNFLTDNDPPSFIAGQPTSSNITGNSINVTAGLDQEGGVFYAVVNSSDIQPSIDQIVTGQNGGNLPAVSSGRVNIFKADSVFQFVVGNVSPLSDYKLYLVGEDFVSNVMADSVVIDFSTPRGQQLLQLEDPGELRFGDTPLDLITSSNSGLPIAITSSNSGVMTINGNLATITGVGTTTITLTQGGNEAYFPASETFDITVGKRLLTITANDLQKTYRSENPVLTLSYDGFLSGDDVSSLAAMPMVSTSAGALSDAGQYAIAVAAAADDVYEIVTENGILTINKAILNVSTGNYSKTYLDELPVIGLTYDGFLGGETVVNLDAVPDFSLSANANSDAGVYPVIISAVIDTNYEIVRENGILTIDKATLNASVGEYSKVYGEQNPDFIITYTGFVGGEDLSVIDNPLNAVTDASQTSDVGDYNISFERGTDNNYEIIPVNGTLEITKAALSATALDQEKSYGQANPRFEIQYSGFLNGDSESDLDDAPAVNTSATTLSDVGEYTLTIPPLVDNNYEISSSDGTLTIRKAELVVTADDQVMQVGSEVPELTLSYSGFQNNDNESDLDEAPIVSTTATSSSTEGEYAIEVIGGLDNNYEFVLENGVISIFDFLPQTISVPSVSSPTYGDDPLVLDATATSELLVTLTSSDEDVISVNGSTLTIVGAGSATITASQGGNSIYAPAPDESLNVTVRKATLSVTADAQSKRVGTINPDLTVSYTGFIGNDDVSVLDELPEITTTATTESTVGSYPITLSGGVDNNYTFNLSNARLTVIAKEEQRITFDEIADASYGDSSFSLVASSDSELPVIFSVDQGGIIEIDGNNVTILNAGTVEITATQEGNVDFNEAPAVSRSLTVSKAELSVTALDQVKRINTENPELEFSYEGFINGDDVSDIDNQPSINTLADVNSEAGEYSTDLSGGSDDNYEFNFVSGILTIEAQLLQTIEFEEIGMLTFGDDSFTLQASSDAQLPVSFSSSDESVISIEGSTATVIGAGNVIITASQDGNVDYLDTSVSREITVQKASQIITFQELDDVSEDVESIILEATSSSGLAVSFALVEGDASIEDNELLINAPGSITVEATQQGNENFNAASAVVRSFEVLVVNSTEDISKLIFNIFPNPAENQLNIQQNQKQGLKIEIIGLTGSSVMASDINDLNNRFDIGHLKSGTYIILITNQKGALLNKSLFIKK